MTHTDRLKKAIERLRDANLDDCDGEPLYPRILLNRVDEVIAAYDAELAASGDENFDAGYACHHVNGICVLNHEHTRR